MAPSTSAGRRRNPGCEPAAGTRRARPATPSEWRTADLPLTVWPCAQQTSQWQRHGRYLPESNRHPAKMLPEIARRAIDFYSDPGDLVLDPMCGIATTVVEAIHLGRKAIGVELEPRWASLAAKNVTHARSQGAAGRALILQDDARGLGRGVLDDLVGQVPLILTSPPYGNATLGDPRGGKGMARARACEGRRMTAADRARAAKAPNCCRYGDSAGSVARLRYGTTDEALSRGNESYLAAMASIYAACTRMLSPGGHLVLVTKNLRADGALRNIAGDTITLCQHAGLVFQQHIIALLAVLRDDGLLPRPSYFQLTYVRQALARGERTHLVCHEDVLVFRKPPASHTNPSAPTATDKR
jgi:modification methylase